jgi:hypothetical protein
VELLKFSVAIAISLKVKAFTPSIFMEALDAAY